MSVSRSVRVCERENGVRTSQGERECAIVSPSLRVLERERVSESEGRFFRECGSEKAADLQGYLAHEKTPSPRTLQ